MPYLEPEKKTELGFLNMPKIPVAGFFLRLLAFMIDLFLLLAALHLLVDNLEEHLLRLGEWAPYVSGTGCFLYFWLFNGPWGGGRTIGKMIVRIQVLDYEGNVPSWRQSALRTIILLPMFVTIPIVSAFASGSGVMQEYFQVLVTSYLNLSVCIATAIVVCFNPYKQGMHDYLARTLVWKRAEGSPTTFEEAATLCGERWKLFHKQPQMSGIATLVLLMALFAYLIHPANVLAPETRAYYQEMARLNDLAGFQKAGITRVPLPAVLQDLRDRQEGFDIDGSRVTEEQVTMEQFEQALKADQESTTSLKLVLSATSPEPFFDPASDEGKRLAGRFLESYQAKVLPLLVAELEKRGEESAKRRQAAGNAGPEPAEAVLDYEKRWAERWPVVPITFELRFYQSVYLSPYPFPVKKFLGSYEQSFPPLR